MMSLKHFHFVAACLAATSTALKCDTKNALDVDVAILGGGASGTYAAIELHRQNKSVAVIDRRPILGGQVNTYKEPATHEHIEYGVNQYDATKVVTDFLDFLKVPYVRNDTRSITGDLKFFDFDEATLVNYSNADPGRTKALQGYANLVVKYPQLASGAPLDPVPEELALPFGEFAKKHGIEKSVLSFDTSLGDVAHLPTLYVFKIYGIPIFEGKFIYTSNGNQEIYDNAANILRDNLFLTTMIKGVERDEKSGVSVCAETQEGERLIRAKQLVTSIAPLTGNLKSIGMDVTPEEDGLFSQFSALGYYTSLVNISGVDQSASEFKNINQSDTEFNVPQLPAIWRVSKTGIPDLYQVEYGTRNTLPYKDIDAAGTAIKDGLEKLRGAGLIKSDDPFEIVELECHSPYLPHVSPEAIRGGFYKKLEALQAKKRTFWTGAAFQTQDSSLLWAYTKNLVANVTSALSD